MTGRVWHGASYVLGRPVYVDEPYPHLCALQFRSPRNGQRMWISRRDCAACLQEAQSARQPPDSDQLPPIDPEITAAEARRLGEHD
jgi:hypothetical protein